MPVYDNISASERTFPIVPSNNNNQPEITWQWALPVMLVPFLCMILLIFEKEQQRILNQQHFPQVSPSDENLPPEVRNSVWGRASTALMSGLAEQRPQVMELANRLLQEDRIHNQTQRASNDHPPTYENPLSEEVTLSQEQPVRPTVSTLSVATFATQNPSSRILRVPGVRRESESSIQSILPSYSMTNVDNYPYLFSPRPSSSNFRTINAIVRPAESSSRTRTSPVTMEPIDE